MTARMAMPIRTVTKSFQFTVHVDQMTIRSEEMNASNGMTSPPGHRKGGFRSGLVRRRAATTAAPGANDSTVAEVMNPTSCCQLGNGRNTIRPTKNARTRLTIGTPWRFVRARTSGALPLRAVAYETREVTVV